VIFPPWNDIPARASAAPTATSCSFDLEELEPADRLAFGIWAVVETLDLRALYDTAAPGARAGSRGAQSAASGAPSPSRSSAAAAAQAASATARGSAPTA
jgi:hypothetical protein